MDKIRIVGKRRLSGEVAISGAKNSALPCIAASLLTSGEIMLSNVPKTVRDVPTMLHLLEHLGGTHQWSDDQLLIDCSAVDLFDAPYDLVKTMRASVLVLGPLVARFGKAVVSLPGGCAIGARPIDLHLKGLEILGATIEIEHGYVQASAEKLKGAQYRFPKVTVTGTENMILAAVLAEGETVLENCALEPEVGDLIQLLRKMGADIQGEDTSTVIIRGVESLGNAKHRIIPDRVEAGTYLMAGAVTGGKLTVQNCEPKHLHSVITTLREIGCRIESEESLIRMEAAETLRSCDMETQPFPGFPTDLQAQYMVLMTQATGQSVIHETIFENRFMHVGELQRMRADITVQGAYAYVKGPTPLSGTSVMATDLRASASLVLAGLIADGMTVVQRVYHIDRGYERIEEKLRNLGAEIERIS